MGNNRVIIVGAGPAGLAAAWELTNLGHEVTVLERDPEYVGGLARTMRYKGCRFDIGAHRFFSKNEEIMKWWHQRLGQDFVRVKRLTRILYRQRFFHYPLRPWQALFGLGPWTSAACILSYLWRQFVPIRSELSFEDWVSNRFGDRLYRIFFKTYTEKVWGMPCHKISADWASQRIKGLSLARAVLDSLGFRQETVKTLTTEFEYPRLGAGMMWEKTRAEIERLGAKVMLDRQVTRFEHERGRVISVCSQTSAGKVERWSADEFIVSMPLQDCVLAMNPSLPADALRAALRLSYRDFILVALIVGRTDLFPDNWIYVHDPGVRVGRIENYNNWSRDMVPKPDLTCLEMEYFCSKDDPLWQLSDSEILELAKHELQQLELANVTDIMDGCVVRVEKAYPVYDTDFHRNVATIRQALAHFGNLQTVGRNGMHKYNNQDHAMLTGMLAARNVLGGRHDVWEVNTDGEYLEEHDKDATSERQVPQGIAATGP